MKYVKKNRKYSLSQIFDKIYFISIYSAYFLAGLRISRLFNFKGKLITQLANYECL